uniref:Si:dkeyp-81f3.4 n=1 Tax=Dicentrarchus labrax TaxID=13489 RepID=A0A8C4I1Q9_DICLA
MSDTDCYKDKIGEDRHSLNMNFTTESALLVKALLDRHRRTVMKEQVDNSADSETTRNVSWVACKDFTVEVGKKQIGEYIQTWEMQPCWLYSLDFLYSTEEEHDTFHHYRARFSTPTPRKPIQGTASVYFVVDISKVKPQTLPVEVLFVVESNRLVHTPGRTRFREKWLADHFSTMESNS